MFQTLETKLSRSVIAGMFACIAIAPAAAQDFGVGVQQDPRAAVAIYDFHFQGPPRGAAYLLAGTLSAPIGLGQIGNLYLNPFTAFPLRAIRLDAQGQGNLRLTLPLCDNVFTPCFQTVFVDVRATVRLSQSAHCVVNAAVPNTPFGYLFDSDTASKQTHMFVRGRPGTFVTYRLRRNGNVIASKTVKIGNGGTGSAVIPGGVQPGDRWSVVYTDKAQNLGIGRGGIY